MEGEPQVMVQSSNKEEMHTQPQQRSNKQANVRMQAVRHWMSARLGPLFCRLSFGTSMKPAYSCMPLRSIFALAT